MEGRIGASVPGVLTMATLHIHTIRLASGGFIRVEPLDNGCGITVVPDPHDQPCDGSTALLTLRETLAVIRAMAEMRA